MKRTQIYITEDEAREVDRCAAREKTTSSEIIRRATDQYLAGQGAGGDWRDGLRAARGMWADRDPAELEALVKRDAERKFDWGR